MHNINPIILNYEILFFNSNNFTFTSLSSFRLLLTFEDPFLCVRAGWRAELKNNKVVHVPEIQ